MTPQYNRRQMLRSTVRVLLVIVLCIITAAWQVLVNRYYDVELATSIITEQKPANKSHHHGYQWTNKSLSPPPPSHTVSSSSSHAPHQSMTHSTGVAKKLKISSVIENNTTLPPINNKEKDGKEGDYKGDMTPLLQTPQINTQKKDIQAKTKSWLRNSNRPWKTPGAFLHVGKTGGSTLSHQLRNGCHSWVRKPCKLDIMSQGGESYISKLSTYYHTPDFHYLPSRHYEFYVVSIRDPFERALSLFTYGHPKNVRIEYPKKPPKPAAKTLYKCFDTLEHFAKYIGDDQQDFDYPDPDVVDASNCTNLARASANHQVKEFNHFYWDTSRVHSLVTRDLKNVTHSSSSNTTRNNYTHHHHHQNTPFILAVRTSNLWPDWIAANDYLGQSSDVLSILELRSRDFSNVTLPVTKKISDIGRRYLCGTLGAEYAAYLDFIDRAVNLNVTEKKQTLETAQEHCPELGLSFATADRRYP